MAHHVKIDSPKDVPAHKDGKPMPVIRDLGHDHDVFDIAKHLNATDGSKGASVSQSQHSLAGDGSFDTEGHFTTHPKNMRAHLPSKEETK